MVTPKAVTNHSAGGGLPTFTSSPAVPTPGTAFTLSWTIPNFKQSGFTAPKVDCAPNYSDGPNFPDGGQDVSAQNQVDGSGNASGSLQVTVNRKEQYVFTLSVQATKGAAFSKQLTLSPGGDPSTQFQFTANGQTNWIEQTAWHSWFDLNAANVLSAVNAKIQSQIVGWVNAENQTLGVTSSDPNSTWANIKAGILKTTGKAVTAFAATNLSTPSRILPPRRSPISRRPPPWSTKAATIPTST